MLQTLKYTPKISTTILFFVLLIAVFLLFLGRNNPGLRVDYLMQAFPDFYQHISNFCISYLLFSGIGYFWLFMGVPLKAIVAFGLVLLFANFIYELWIPLINTPDIIDAYYDAWGTLLGFAFLLWTKCYGLNPVKKD
ncbi:hypothetical protein [Sphingobacterium hungaricum]|uniref:hypothetical protein n=1 Tax=Sphingobacterium hungaricum TaxID=2082723 RepID=UPI0018C9873A|nr:hypothetical protein [Sphingobacterium hungaricum]